MQPVKPLDMPCDAITTQGRYVLAIARVKGGENFRYNGRSHFIPLSGIVCTHESNPQTLDDAFIIDERELVMIAAKGLPKVTPADFFVIRHYARGTA